MAGVVLLAAVLLGAAPFVWVRGDAVIPGVSVQGIPAGGWSKTKLADFLKEQDQTVEKEKLELVRDSVHEEWSYKDLGVHYSENSVDEAMHIGREGSLLRQWKDRWQSLLFGRTAPMEAQWDDQALDRKIKGLQSAYGKPAQNALPTFHNDGSITFSHGRPYMKIGEEELRNAVIETLETGRGGQVEIPVAEEKKPNMSDQEAGEVNSILGKYTTHFGGDSNRSSNISLAAEKISGTYLKPGSEFSYNQTTGSRSAANGYKEAPVIINGKLEPGSGGGVCQVSSTLFNAVILAGLEVTQRTCHYSPVSYVPLGRDATVAEGVIDFRFRNHLKHGIYIYTEYAPGTVTVFILGNRDDKPSYVDISKTKEETLPFKTVSRVDPAQQEDKKTEEGHEGKNVTVKQSVKWADGRVYHDLFESDYEAVDTVITYKNKEDVPQD